MYISEEAREIGERLDRFVSDLSQLLEALDAGVELTFHDYSLGATAKGMQLAFPLSIDNRPEWKAIDGSWIGLHAAARHQSTTAASFYRVLADAAVPPIPLSIRTIGHALQQVSETLYRHKRDGSQVITDDLRRQLQTLQRFAGLGTKLWLDHVTGLVPWISASLERSCRAVNKHEHSGGCVGTGVRCALLGYRTAPIVSRCDVEYTLDAPPKYTTTVAYFLPSTDYEAKPEFVATIPLNDEQRERAIDILGAWERELAGGSCQDSDEPHALQVAGELPKNSAEASAAPTAARVAEGALAESGRLSAPAPTAPGEDEGYYLSIDDQIRTLGAGHHATRALAKKQIARIRNHAKKKNMKLRTIEGDQGAINVHAADWNTVLRKWRDYTSSRPNHQPEMPAAENGMSLPATEQRALITWECANCNHVVEAGSRPNTCKCTRPTFTRAKQSQTTPRGTPRTVLK